LVKYELHRPTIAGVRSEYVVNNKNREGIFIAGEMPEALFAVGDCDGACVGDGVGGSIGDRVGAGVGKLI